MSRRDRDYWTPRFKWQLVEELKRIYPGGKFDRMSKRQLWAIWHAMRARPPFKGQLKPEPAKGSMA